MTKVLCMKRADGGCTIRVPAESARLNGESDDDFLKRVEEAHPRGDCVSCRVMDTADLPDREFRDAWEDDGASVKVNLAKAKQIQRDRIRNAKLRHAQALLIRETAGDNVTAERTALQAIDEDALTAAPRSVTGLKAAWPPDLPKP